MKDGQVTIIPNEQGNRITPSYVSFGTDRLIGDAAKNQAASNPTATIHDAKRFVHLALSATRHGHVTPS